MQDSNPSTQKRSDGPPKDCPVCGDGIIGFSTRGPSDTVAQPCGHRVSAHPTQDLAADGGVDTAAWYDLTAFQRDILRAVLAIEQLDVDSYGLAIKRELERRYGTEIHHGRLYPNLNDIVEAGYLEKSTIDQRTNEYTLTTTGRQLLEATVALDTQLVDGTDLRARTDGGGA